MTEVQSSTKMAWSINEIATSTGLSPAFIRGDIRRGLLLTRKFGRRVVVLDRDLRNYLDNGSEGRKGKEQ